MFSFKYFNCIHPWQNTYITGGNVCQKFHRNSRHAMHEIFKLFYNNLSNHRTQLCILVQPLRLHMDCKPRPYVFIKSLNVACSRHEQAKHLPSSKKNSQFLDFSLVNNWYYMLYCTSHVRCILRLLPAIKVMTRFKWNGVDTLLVDYQSSMVSM